MKAETLIYGYEFLAELDDLYNISFEELEKKSKIKGKELRELLKYLVKRDLIKWKSALFVGTGPVISPDEIKLTHNGMEVVLGEREYFENTKNISQTIENQTNVTNSSEIQVSQSTGDNSSIVQTQEIKIGNLKKELEKELMKEKPDESKVKKLVKSIIGIAKNGASGVISGIILKVLG